MYSDCPEGPFQHKFSIYTIFKHGYNQNRHRKGMMRKERKELINKKAQICAQVAKVRGGLNKSK